MFLKFVVGAVVQDFISLAFFAECQNGKYRKEIHVTPMRVVSRNLAVSCHR